MPEPDPEGGGVEPVGRAVLREAQAVPSSAVVNGTRPLAGDHVAGDNRLPDVPHEGHSVTGRRPDGVPAHLDHRVADVDAGDGVRHEVAGDSRSGDAVADRYALPPLAGQGVAGDGHVRRPVADDDTHAAAPDLVVLDFGVETTDDLDAVVSVVDGGTVDDGVGSVAAGRLPRR